MVPSWLLRFLQSQLYRRAFLSHYVVNSVFPELFSLVYRFHHYEKELARKPQAVRQVAPELLSELGEPYTSLWQQLCERYSQSVASRVLAALIGLRSEHGGEKARERLEALLSPSSLAAHDARPNQPTVGAIDLPARLAAVEIQSGVAADYDQLLLVGGRR